jgi:two-component system chemotaxis response regulator CheB
MSIVLIGGSAGSGGVISDILSKLDSRVKAPIVLLRHTHANGFDMRLNRVRKESSLEVRIPDDQEEPEPGVIYLPKSNHHLLLKDGKFVHRFGPKENLFRPAIDPLFRTAAIDLGSRVLAVLLSGRLNDGTSGMVAVVNCGGTAILQDPETAEYPDMLTSAIQHVEPHFICKEHEIANKIIELSSRNGNGAISMGKINEPNMQELIKEAEVSYFMKSQKAIREDLAVPAPYGCPSCGGPLFEMKVDKVHRYRCHIGHAYTAETYLEEQQKALDDSLATSLRMMEERVSMMQKLVDDYKKKNMNVMVERLENQLNKYEDQVVDLRGFICDL